LFHQAEELSHLHTLRLERLESVGMAPQQIQGELRIGGIILGAARFEGFAVLASVDGLMGKSTKKSYFCSA